MKEFKAKLDAVLNVIEKESGLKYDYSVYENRNKALSILDELHLEEKQEDALLSMFSEMASNVKVALVLMESEINGVPEALHFVFDESDVNEMYDSIEEEATKEDWEIALASEDFGLNEIKDIREALLDEKHGFVLEVLYDSYDILDFVRELKKNKKLKSQLVTELSKGLSGALSLDELVAPIVVFISKDSTVAFVGDENFKALKDYIADAVFYIEEESSRGVVEYADGWGYDYDIEEDEDEDDYNDECENCEDEDEDYGVVAPFWLI